MLREELHQFQVDINTRLDIQTTQKVNNLINEDGLDFL